MKLSDPEFIKCLEMLAILARRVLGGSLKSDRRTRKKGSGTTFADYAEYSFGDDYRNIDWNIYARMESLVVKLFELEEDATINILLDLSPSMGSKLDYAKKLAAALAYIALNNHDRLAIHGVADSLQPVVQLCHGRAKIFPMLNALENAKTFGSDTRLSSSVRKFQMRQKRPGVCVVISDFFSPEGFKEALDCLRWSKNDVFCIQTLDKAEISCEWRGDLELQCIETGELKKVTVSPIEARRYADAMREWNESLKTECARQGVGLVSAITEVPFEDVIQNILRRGGLVA